jgi:hypothetical protein
VTGASEDEVDAAVGIWHSLPDDGVELHDFLGWSWTEYGDWVAHSLIPDRPLPEAVRHELERNAP